MAQSRHLSSDDPVPRAHKVTPRPATPAVFVRVTAGNANGIDVSRAYRLKEGRTAHSYSPLVLAAAEADNPECGPWTVASVETLSAEHLTPAERKRLRA